MFFGTLIKNVHAVGFSGKPDFLERVRSHRAMFCLINFGIVHVVIFIKKYVQTNFTIFFCELLMILWMKSLNMLIYFFKHDKNGQL